MAYNVSSSWDVSADDQTLLMARRATDEGGNEFVLVNHFFEELKARVPQ